jgi:hypothetical protein
MRECGLLKGQSHDFVTLLPKDLSVADRTQADSYQPGDTLRFLRSNQTLGVAAKSYAQVIEADTARNTITVQNQDGRTLTYNPADVPAVSLFGSKILSLAVGDRLQFTSNSKQHGFSTRDVGTA